MLRWSSFFIPDVLLCINTHIRTKILEKKLKFLYTLTARQCNSGIRAIGEQIQNQHNNSSIVSDSNWYIYRADIALICKMDCKNFTSSTLMMTTRRRLKNIPMYFCSVAVASAIGSAGIVNSVRLL